VQLLQKTITKKHKSFTLRAFSGGKLAAAAVRAKILPSQAALVAVF
jgi:hypothetical protein